MKYNLHMKKTIDNKTYTEIFNDKIVTYSISHVTCRKNSNTIYTKEVMNYNDLRAINHEILYCVKILYIEINKKCLCK